MSIDLHIKRSSGAEESIPVCGQRTAEDFIGGLAREHGFRILTGIYPVWVRDSDLDELLNELRVIRASSAQELVGNERFSDDDRAYIDGRWGKVIALLEPLAAEKDWEVTFG